MAASASSGVGFLPGSGRARPARLRKRRRESPNQRWVTASRDCGARRDRSSIDRSHPAFRASRPGSRESAAMRPTAFQEHPMLELIGAILVGAFALTFGVLCIGPMMLGTEDL